MFVSGGTLVTKTILSSSQWPLSGSPVDLSTAYMPGMAGSCPTVYGVIYRRQLWVYVLVNKLARGLSRLPLVTYRHDELNRPRWPDHPVAKLLAKPNPALSPFHMWFWVSATRDVYGRAWLYKGRDASGAVKSLWPLHPTGMSRPDNDGLRTWSNGRLLITGIRPSDLLDFKLWDPEDTDAGLSPLEPLRATLENEWSARSATSSFWRHGARPGVVLTHPNRLSDGALRRLKQQWDDAVGGADKQGATVVLEEGMTPQLHQLTAEEAQYIETRKLNREEACAAYDVPPPAVHILDRATFSNITEQMRSLYRDTHAPRCRDLEATVMTDLVAVDWPNDPVYVEFLLDEVMRGDFETRQDALNKATHMTIAEKRRVENLPYIEGTDRIFLNTATLPLDAIDAQAAAQGRSLSADALRTVMGRLSWQTSMSDVALSALVDGLPPADAEVVVSSAVRSATVPQFKATLKEAR